MNVFALVFLTTFASLISLFSMGVLRFCIFMARFRKALAPRIDRWVQDGVFQLQRRAFEAQDGGRWVGAEREIPVTWDRERLRELPVTAHVVKEKSSVGSFDTQVGKQEEKEKMKQKTLAEDEDIEWRKFRVSVQRVDTSATLVCEDLEDAECGKGDKAGKA